MNKLIINAILLRKEPIFEPQKCIVEKAVGVSHNEFTRFRENLMRNNPHIQANINLMYVDRDNNYHCLLIYDQEQGDGIIVESEGSEYARYSQYIPNAKLLLENYKLNNLQEMKFYCPLVIRQDASGDYDEYEEVSPYEAAEYESQIKQFIRKFTEPEEKERGLMHWYGDNNSVSEKVHSAFASVEIRENQLYGVITAKIYGELTSDELMKFSDYCVGQCADGWGEGFEQRPIKTCDGDIYVSFWNGGSEYFFKPEHEVFKQQDELMKSSEEETVEPDLERGLSM